MTLILLRGHIQDVTLLKQTLDSFSEATGLYINYNKSTVVPLHMDEAMIQQCIQILNCKRDGFPQSYLGLPLSHEKLRLQAYTPYICKTDRYLAGWQASLLNANGQNGAYQFGA